MIMHRIRDRIRPLSSLMADCDQYVFCTICMREIILEPLHARISLRLQQSYLKQEISELRI
jgi:hypothetical protein